MIATILQRLDDDDVLRHTFQFAGASRTNRWAGRGFQPTNLPRTGAASLSRRGAGPGPGRRRWPPARSRSLSDSATVTVTVRPGTASDSGPASR